MAAATPRTLFLAAIAALLTLTSATPLHLSTRDTVSDKDHKNLVTGLAIAGALLGACIIFFLFGIFMLCTRGTFLCIVRPSKSPKALAEQEAVKRMEELELRDMDRERRRRAREAEESLPTYEAAVPPTYEREESNVVDPRQTAAAEPAAPAAAYYMSR